LIFTDIGLHSFQCLAKTEAYPEKPVMSKERKITIIIPVMKNLDLKNLGVQEMNTAEMVKVEGGGLLGGALTGLLGSVALTVNTLSNDASAFLSKTLANALRFVWGL
jgi:hypothetical protein